MQGCELLLNLRKNKVNIRGSKLTAGLCGREWKGEGPSFGTPAPAWDVRYSPSFTSSTHMASQACALSAGQCWPGRQAHDASKGGQSISCTP